MPSLGLGQVLYSHNSQGSIEGGVLRSLGLSLSLLGGGSAGGLLLLDVLGEELLVLGSVLLGRLEAVELLALEDLLAAEALLGDQALDLGGLVVGLVTTLDLTASDVLADIVSLAEAEHLGDVSPPLLEEAGADVLVSAASDFLLTLLDDLEGDDGEVSASDATTDRSPSAVASSLGVEESALYKWKQKKD